MGIAYKKGKAGSSTALGDLFNRATVMNIALNLIKGNVADYCTKRVTVIRWKTIPVAVFYFLKFLLPGSFPGGGPFKTSRPA